MRAGWIAGRVEARDAEHVAALMRDVAGPPWIPLGGETGLGRGSAPVPPVRGLGLSALDAVIEHAVEDLTLTVQGGLTAGTATALLLEKGQWLPCLEGLDPRATVGGIIASDRRAPWAGAWGGTRDALLGIAFVDGTGRPARGGGRVVKNVAGYDLMKLMTGTLGEFGVIVEATFKVLPLPPAAGGVLLAGEDPARVSAAAAATSVGGSLRGLWRFDRGDGERLLAAYLGSRGDVAARVAETLGSWGSRARALERDELGGWAVDFADWVRPDRDPVGWGGALPGYLAGIRPADAFGDAEYLLDLLAGHLWLRGKAVGNGVAGVRDRLREGEGHLHLDLPPDSPIPAAAVWGIDPGPEAELWRGIKKAFDPEARLVSGRLPGGV